MFVYGIRCPVTAIPLLPPETQADYYMEYALLVFPSYTRPTTLRSSYIPTAQLSTDFTNLCQKIIECEYNEAIPITHLEHPFITESEDEAVAAIRQEMPEFDIGWFHVPAVRA